MKSTGMNNSKTGKTSPRVMVGKKNYFILKKKLSSFGFKESFALLQASIINVYLLM
jgi:hypothetical protein